MRFQGRRDIPLNDTGREQALQNGKRLARILGNPDDYQFIASPLWRARETMEIMREQMDMPRDGYLTDERLVEVSYGELEGTTQPELKERDRELYYYRKQNAWTFRPSGGESHEDVVVRVSDWISSLEDGERYIVAAHGAIGRVMLHLLAGSPPDEVSRFAFPQDKVFCFHEGRQQQY